MLNLIFYSSLVVTSIAGGVLFSYFYLDHRRQQRLKKIQSGNANLLEKARAEAAKLIAESKQYVEALKQEQEEELKEIGKRLQSYTDRLKHRESVINMRFQNVEQQQAKVAQFEAGVQELQAELQRLSQEELSKLEQKTGINREHAGQELFRRYEEKTREDLGKMAQRNKDFLQDFSEQEARNIITSVLQRMSDKTSRDAIPYAFSIKVAERDRLIGERGETLRLLEELTQAEFLFDDANLQLYVGGYNLVNRSVGKITVETLLKQRKFKPDQIKEIVERAKQTVSNKMVELGRKTVNEFGVKDFDPKLVKLIGRMYYRTSFGQNILKHCREVTFFSVLLASELGANVEVCKRAALLHDVGKAVDTEIEGSHDVLTKEICEKFGISPEITYAAYNHHEREEMHSIEARIVQIADAISASRPGARQESLDKYLERLEQLEKVSNSFPGIEKSFAIQAGREVRVMVKPEEVSDEQMKALAKEIASKIEQEVVYPGEIKVNLSRETKSTEYAK